ncbi:MAG: hypothetical protein Q7V62_04190, partial [Actinomycetota bacterium]|nr:hypothetical protein [Actinomycetota bacterium]
MQENVPVPTSDHSSSTAPANGGRIRLRYTGKCGTCGTPLYAGTTAYYVRDAKKAYCDEHAPAELPLDAATPFPTPRPPMAEHARITPVDPGLPVAIKIRYAGSCGACLKPLAKGADAFYVRGAQVMVCVECTQREVQLGLAVNPPGAGAERIADAAGRRHAERLLAAYPMLGDQLIENAKPPKNVHAWVRGADG